MDSILPGHFLFFHHKHIVAEDEGFHIFLQLQFSNDRSSDNRQNKANNDIGDGNLPVEDAGEQKH